MEHQGVYRSSSQHFPKHLKEVRLDYLDFDDFFVYAYGFLTFLHEFFWFVYEFFLTSDLYKYNA